ncbi:MAG TPA: PP2C family protein-serine/threonine phosphatase [Thermoanaerobaculia bacterium]
MKAPTLDELVLLPEPLALQRHFDAKNYRVFRWLLVLLMLISLGGLAGVAKAGNSLGIIFLGGNVFYCAALFVLRDREVFARNFRQILLTWLLVEILILKVGSAPAGPEHQVPFILLAFALIVFRLRFTEHLLLFAALLAIGLFPLEWMGLTARQASPENVEGMAIGLTVVVLFCLIIAAVLSRLERKKFLNIWRREHSRQRERLRMREEIEYARKIQLSMLPQGAPDLDWIDLAAASLPATEVGGDYYEYFQVGESRLILVIGDVAGHGLASGLLLSGVRSCLYLLEQDLGEPLQILERLNHMVRRTTDKRTYMTLLCAVVDYEEKFLSVVSAGHPPVLYFDPGSGTFDEVGEGAPPLGTFLQARYEEVRHPLGSGHFLIFYTDGMVEARSAKGEEYGYARLRRVVARAATESATAREVRDSVLGDLSHFKGDQEQADDITLVVVRLR